MNSLEWNSRIKLWSGLLEWSTEWGVVNCSEEHVHNDNLAASLRLMICVCNTKNDVSFPAPGSETAQTRVYY